MASYGWTVNPKGLGSKIHIIILSSSILFTRTSDPNIEICKNDI